MQLFIKNLTTNEDMTLTFPMNPADIKKQLENCEFICEDASYKNTLRLVIGSYLSIDEVRALNILDKLCKDNQSDIDIDRYINSTSLDLQKDYLSMCNHIYNDDTCFYPYDFCGIENCLYESNEKLFGRTMAEENGLADSLESLNIEDFFDYEQYGSYQLNCSNVILFDDGYVFCSSANTKQHDITLAEFEEILF